MACNDGFYNTAPVASYRANAWGLYDMTGNVWEWVEDMHHESSDDAPTDGSAWISGGKYRVRRGASWVETSEDARVANRDWSGAKYHRVDTTIAWTPTFVWQGRKPWIYTSCSNPTPGWEITLARLLEGQ